MTLLLALLAISYVGSMLMQGRGLRGYGLPSGTEWVLLGFVTGPRALGLVESGMLRAFEPVAAMAVGWLALVIGAGSLRARPSRARVTAVAIGVVLAAITAVSVALAVYLVGLGYTSLSQTELLIAASGIGLVSCETTRHAVGWVVERYAARGPLSDFVAAMADADDVVPLLLTAVPFALLQPSSALPVPWWASSAVPLLLGALFGVTSAALLRFESSASRGWGVVLGASLLVSGIVWRIEASPLAAMFMLGATLAALSRHRVELAGMLARTEPGVLLPTLLLVGARLNPVIAPRLALLLLVACAARVLVRGATAPLVVAATGTRSRHVARALGLGLLSTGSVAMTVGLTFALRFPGVTGEIVVCAAAAQTLLGELLGPAALRRALDRAGELERGSTIAGTSVAESST
jgi:hypothetical protein